jgi:hypothetical protein
LVLSGAQEAWQTLQAGLFPTRAALDVSEQLLVAQALPEPRKPLKEALVTPLPAATCRDGRPVQIEALGDFIGDLLVDQGQIRSHLSVVLPAAAAHWRVLSWPLRSWPENPLAQLRHMEPDLGLPFRLDDASIDLAPLRSDDAQALAVAIERGMLQSWLDVFGVAGVQLDRIVPCQLAVMVGLQEQLAAADPRGLVALLQPELKALRLLVWHRGVPLYERLISGAPAAQVAELGRCLAFLRKQRRLADNAPCELLIDALPEQSAEPLEPLRQELERLQLQPELVDSEGYGTLALLGLARMEAAS